MLENTADVAVIVIGMPLQRTLKPLMGLVCCNSILNNVKIMSKSTIFAPISSVLLDKLFHLLLFDIQLRDVI